MRTTLFVDDKKVEEPDADTIARELESIDKATGFRSRGLSLVILQRGEEDSLTAGGHPVEGWRGLIREVKGISRAAKLPRALRQAQIIQIFQSYAQGGVSWERAFEWETVETPWNKRILIWLVVLLVILFLLRKLLL
jgi:hypothetical protein